jgi:hypothetical protein
MIGMGVSQSCEDGYGSVSWLRGKGASFHGQNASGAHTKDHRVVTMA